MLAQQSLVHKHELSIYAYIAWKMFLFLDITMEMLTDFIESNLFQKTTFIFASWRWRDSPGWKYDVFWPHVYWLLLFVEEIASICHCVVITRSADYAVWRWQMKFSFWTKSKKSRFTCLIRLVANIIHPHSFAVIIILINYCGLKEMQTAHIFTVHRQMTISA